MKKVVSIVLVLMMLFMQFDVFASSYASIDLWRPTAVNDDSDVVAPDEWNEPGIDPGDGVNPIIWQPPTTTSPPPPPTTTSPPPPTTTSPPPLPAPPTITTPTNSAVISATTSLTANWNPVSYAGYYKVSLRQLTDNILLLDNERADNTSYSLSGIQSGKTYRLAVAGVSSSGIGTYAVTTFSVAQPVVVKTPTLQNPVITGPSTSTISATTALTATWQNVTNATAYQVTLKDVTAGNPGTIIIQNASTTNTTYPLPGINPGKKYALKIMALASGYNSGSTELEFTVGPAAPVVEVPPSAPTNLTAELINGNTIQLKWDPSTSAAGIQGYDVYRNGEALQQVIVTPNCLDTIPGDPNFAMIENAVGGQVVASEPTPIGVNAIVTSSLDATGTATAAVASADSEGSTNLNTESGGKVVLEYTIYAKDKNGKKSLPVKITLSLMLDDGPTAQKATVIKLATPRHIHGAFHHSQADVDAFKFVAAAGGRYTFLSTSDIKITLLDVTDNPDGVLVSTVSTVAVDTTVVAPVTQPVTTIPPVNTVVVSPPSQLIDGAPTKPGAGLITIDPVKPPTEAFGIGVPGENEAFETSAQSEAFSTEAQSDAAATAEALTPDLLQPEGDTNAIKVGDFFRDLTADRIYVILVSSTSTKAVPGAYGFGVDYSAGGGNVGYNDLYPLMYIDGIIKPYETHKMINGRFVLDNGGQTIGYGHDVLPGEDFSNGLSENEALDLLMKDLNSKSDTIKRYINILNLEFGYNILIGDLSKNEMLFFVDFVFNRGAGLVERPELKAAGKPFSSLAILLTAVSEKNDKKIIDTLMEETYNLEHVYYEGLKLRRMDQYEILKFRDFVRDYDAERDYTKPKK